MRPPRASPSLGGPDVSIVSVQTTIGPRHLTYYRRLHGRRVAFHPRGVSVPERCPRGGLPFAAPHRPAIASSAAAVPRNGARHRNTVWPSIPASCGSRLRRACR